MRPSYLSRKARWRPDGHRHSVQRHRSPVRRRYEEEENSLTWGPGEVGDRGERATSAQIGLVRAVGRGAALLGHEELEAGAAKARWPTA